MKSNDKRPWTGRTWLLATGPSITAAAAGLWTHTQWGTPFWVAVGATLLLWIPSPLSLTTMIVHADLDAWHEMRTEGLSLPQRMGSYGELMSSSWALGRDLRVSLLSVLAAVCLTVPLSAIV